MAGNFACLHVASVPLRSDTNCANIPFTIASS